MKPSCSCKHSTTQNHKSISTFAAPISAHLLQPSVIIPRFSTKLCSVPDIIACAVNIETRTTCACYRYKSIDYQALRYYSAPKFKKQLNSLEEVDPEILKTFEKLGISLNEQARPTLNPVRRISEHSVERVHLSSCYGCTRLCKYEIINLDWAV